MKSKLLIVSYSFLGIPEFESTDKPLLEIVTEPTEVSNEAPDELSIKISSETSTEIQAKPTPFSEKTDENKKSHDYTTLVLYASIAVILIVVALIGRYNEGKIKLPSVFTSEPYDELPMAMNDINFERERGG